MNIMKIERFSTSNGQGLRHVLWTAGCDFHCPGCHNPETWSRQSGRPWTAADYDRLTEDFKTMPDILDGITFLGGEPLLDTSLSTITEIAKKFKEEYPNKTIWLWTGNLYENVKDLDVMSYIDVLVDGQFDLSKMDLRLKWAGSTNQCVIDVKKSRQTGKIILLQEEF